LGVYWKYKAEKGRNRLNGNRNSLLHICSTHETAFFCHFEKGGRAGEAFL
jgi:hypothetical protein